MPARRREEPRFSEEEKKRALEILARLEDKYPDARVELEYASPFELLVATILAAQCTDRRVNEVTRTLFQKYRTPEDYLRAPAGELEEAIRPTGFFRNKAKAIRACCKKLVEEFGGQVPTDLEVLASFPGVGRKTASIVLGNAAGQQTIAVDTHVKRVARRLGFTNSNNPLRIEEDLRALIPQDRWTRATNTLVFHGRYTCKARNPACRDCPVAHLCAWPDKRDGGSTSEGGSQ
ncbi:MAG: endonuclease III [candidate division KSB1 bacterium]|nr:endonuclease III [candidate division KSB1 bacterium]